MAFGFSKMGIAGAAPATSISKLLELAWAYVESLREKHVRLHVRFCFAVDKLLARDCWRYSLPMLGDYLVYGAWALPCIPSSWAFGKRRRCRQLDCQYRKNLIVSFCTGLANGGGIIVGNELGMGDLKQAKSTVAFFGKWRLSAASPPACFGGALTLDFESNSAKSAGHGISEMDACPLCLLHDCEIHQYDNHCRHFPAGGDSKFGLICDTITMWAFAPPVGFLAAFYFHLPVVAVFLIINLDEVVKVPAAILHYKKIRMAEKHYKGADNTARQSKMRI